jgi:uncharacterized protein (TIGR00251 family)
MIPCQERPDGVSFQIKVLPRSSRCEAGGIHGNALKIRITAPPLEGKANEEVIRFLAKRLEVRPHQVAIVSGVHHPLKTISVWGLTSKQLQERLGDGHGE